jgi:hypothetical protein
MEPDPDPDPTPDPTTFYSDFKDAKKIHFFHILPAGTLSSIFKAKRGRNGSKKPQTVYNINVS